MHARRAAGGFRYRGERERRRVFSVVRDVRGDKNRETLYRFVGRAAFTIFLRAAVRRKTPVSLSPPDSFAHPVSPSFHFLFP